MKKPGRIVLDISARKLEALLPITEGLRIDQAAWNPDLRILTLYVSGSELEYEGDEPWNPVRVSLDRWADEVTPMVKVLSAERKVRSVGQEDGVS